MATKNEPPPPAPAEAPAVPKKKLGKILIIAGIVLVLLIGAGTAAFLLLGKKPPADDEETATEAAPKKQSKDVKDDRKPAYSTLDPFTVNLSSETGDQFLQVALTLDMDSAEAIEKTKVFMAKIRNDIMLHLSGKKPAELATKEGKQLLALELRGLINAVLDPGSASRKGDKAAAGPVREVLFTSFIIQ